MNEELKKDEGLLEEPREQDHVGKASDQAEETTEGREEAQGRPCPHCCCDGANEANEDDLEDPEVAPRLSNKELGRKGEVAARRFLERRGFTILETNWKCFAGEADIIAMDGDVLCFVEVKTRRGVKHGFPAEAVTPEKRHRYEKIAGCYLCDFEKTETRVRFDVISIVVLSESRAFLRMHTNAFGADCGE